MDLSFWLTTVSLLCGAYALAVWANGSFLEPRRVARAASGVKRRRRRFTFRRGSEGSNVQNDANAGSGHQDAGSERSAVQSVQTANAPPAAAAGDAGQGGDGFTLTPRELAQLGEAINLRREGATVEQCLSQAFGVSKGGSEGYRRAKALWDAATVTPGAAPEGTYAPVKRRRARRAAR